MRFGFHIRLAFIIVTGFSTIATVLAIANYLERSDATKEWPRIPFPDQLAAMVQLIEKSPSDERKLLLRAFNSTFAKVYLQNRGMDLKKYVRLHDTEKTFQKFFKVLEDREIRILALKGLDQPSSISDRYFLPSDVQISVRLKSQEYLIIKTGTSLNLSFFGVPPGFWASFMGFFIATITMIAVLREIGPLVKLADSVQKFSRQATPVMLEEKGAWEVRMVICAFNQMQQKIDRLFKGRVFMLSAISHDMRTYLTRFRLRVEKVEDSVRKTLVSDIEDMSAMIDEALELTRVTTGHGSPKVLHLSEIVKDECYKAQVEDQDVKFLVGTDKGIKVFADERSIRRAIGNIIDNAIKYGECAEVSIGIRENSACIYVDDHGPGISVEARETVLEPFQRIETSRSRGTGGTGLGLSIATELIRRDSGELSIEDSPAGGARLIIEYPVYKDKI